MSIRTLKPIRKLPRILKTLIKIPKESITLLIYVPLRRN